MINARAPLDLEQQKLRVKSAEESITRIQERIAHLKNELESAELELSEAHIVLKERQVVVDALYQATSSNEANCTNESVTKYNSLKDYITPAGQIITEKLLRDTIGNQEFTIDSVLKDLKRTFGEDVIEHQWKSPRASLATFLTRAQKKGIISKENNKYKFI